MVRPRPEVTVSLDGGGRDVVLRTASVITACLWGDAVDMTVNCPEAIISVDLGKVKRQDWEAVCLRPNSFPLLGVMTEFPSS